jgi:hypothetical protein
MNKIDRDGRGLRRQIRRILKDSGGTLKLDGSRESLVEGILGFVAERSDLNRREAARLLGMKNFQLDYILSKARESGKKPKEKSLQKAPKLSRVQIVDEPGVGGTGELELCFENGIRVSVKSAGEAADLLHELNRRGSRGVSGKPRD